MHGSDSKVFLSYAHTDGAILAQRLHRDLFGRSVESWLDSRRIRAGAVWTKDIETALDGSDVILALLTAGSYASEICRAEQLRALRKHKCVIPLLAQKGADVPLHLEATHYRDFTESTTYQVEFDALLKDIGARSGVSLQPQHRETYVTAPPLPVNYVERAEALENLRNVLVVDGGGGRHVALTALEGMGGIGKTVLAQALCHDEIVQQAFPDGVIWITVGQEPAYDLVTRMREVGKALKDDVARYDNELGSINQYRSTFRHKAALIVLDDIWRVRDVEPFCADSPRSRLLITTRDASIGAALGAEEQIADLLTDAQSREVLTRWSGRRTNDLPQPADDIIAECGRLPLALSMVGAMLRGKPAAFWRRVLDLLRQADLDKVKVQFPNYAHPNLFRAIQVSVDRLDANSRERYLALAILLEDMAADPAILRGLWNTDENAVLANAEQFVSLSLAQRRGETGAIYLHDLQLDYVRSNFPDRDALELIHAALRLSAHVIGSDPTQFASQITARLLPHAGQPQVGQLLARIAEGAPRPWLRPMHPGLIAPGGALTRTLKGHSRSVAGVAVTADGRRAVSASGDETLKVWDVDTGRELRTLKGHSGAVVGVAVSADGHRALSASYDHTLRVWDVETGLELRALKGHSGAVNAVAVSADGRRAVSAAADRTLKVWDVDTGRELRTLKGHSGAVVGVAVGADGRCAVSGSEDQTVKVWDLEANVELRTLKGHSGAVTSVAVSADGRRAVSVSDDRTLRVWEMDTGQELRIMEGHSDVAQGVALSADGRRAVSASRDGTLKVWEVETGRDVSTLGGHSGPVYGVAVSADGRRAVSAGFDRTLKVWEIERGSDFRMLDEGSKSINGVAISADGRRAVSASSDHALKVWDVKTGLELRSLKGHSGAVNAVAVNADGRRAVSASADGTLKVWNIDTGGEICTLKGHSSYALGVAVSANGQRAVSTSWDQTIKVWDVDTGRELYALEGHTAPVVDVAMSADGRRAVSASRDQTLKVWDVETGRELRTLNGHSNFVTGVSVSADGRRAVSASWDHTLRVWDVETGRELRTLKGHSNWVNSVAVSRDGRRAVSAAADHTLKLWEVDTGAMLATFTCDGVVAGCAFGGSATVVAGDVLGRIHFLYVVLDDTQ